MSKIRVLIIDDSALVRSLLTEIVSHAPDLEVVGSAPDPLVAREMIRALNPDVLTLDVEMPKMDGLDFLERLMRLRPMPVVMVSTLTERGAETTMRALELGAVDFVAKPRIGVASGMKDLARDIVEKIRIAASAHLHRRAAPAASVAGEVRSRPASFSRVSTEKLIAIGSSTGGTEAVREVLVRLPAESHTAHPGTVRLRLVAKDLFVPADAELTPALLLSHLHLWSDDTVENRFNYRTPGLYVLSVRVCRAAQVHEIHETADQRGCKSWVTLEHPLPTDPATPILTDKEYADVQMSLDLLLTPTAFA